jgi:3-hydroxyethyl bacteriochlorophyllide a dehydrogenase
MNTPAIVIDGPGRVDLKGVELRDAGPDDVVVEVHWSGISSGTERLLWSGRMPDFPGMGYPLVPGYETVGKIIDTGENAGALSGATVFVPGANAFRSVRSLFGGAAGRLVVPSARVSKIDGTLGDRATLLALAATAHHVFPPDSDSFPELIVGHGVLGRLLARLILCKGGSPPTVWEVSRARRAGDFPYAVLSPESDPRKDYARICDVSGSSKILDQVMGRLAPGGEIVLGGFYADPLAFEFPPAFMREARIRVAAQWRPDDLAAVIRLVDTGALSLEGLITDYAPASDASRAYVQAFDAEACLKMVLDWRGMS